MDPNEFIALFGGAIGITVLSLVCGGLFSLLITVGIIGAMVLVIRSGMQRSREIRARASAAAPATATIVAAESFSSRHSSRLYVQLTLDVQPQYGSVYRTETHWAVDYVAAGSLQPGSTVEVRVDPAQPGVVYPGVPWAEYSDRRVYRLR